MAPQNYSVYVGGYHGVGAYPNNSEKLVEDMIDIFDPFVNFSNYDNDGDGDVDGLAVIHAGQGAEVTGNVTDMWSHKKAISPRLRDGVYLSDYFIHPE